MSTLEITSKFILFPQMIKMQIIDCLYLTVTETEVQEGLLGLHNPSKHCLWFKRNIEDIEKQPSSKLLSRFIGQYA